MSQPVQPEDIRRQAEDLISKVLGFDPAEVRPATRVREDLGLEAFDLVELLPEMESRFGIRLPDRALEGAATVDDIVGTARRAVADQRPSRAAEQRRGEMRPRSSASESAVGHGYA